jgi:toluene monooxygenase system protein A
MTLLKREEWHDITRMTDWDFDYVPKDAAFPEWMSGGGKTDEKRWQDWREDYRCSYREYVATQREKDSGAYSVKAALQRSSVYDDLDEGSKTNSKLHFGSLSLIEYVAVPAELCMARFGLTGGWRNMAVLGALDEMRHTQLNLMFAHELVPDHVHYDWAHKAYHTDNWAIIAGRALFDNTMVAASAVDIAIGLPFTVETGFTNLQFVALAAGALQAGDINFANLISSIQTDEARHAQQGGPTLDAVMETEPERAQWIVDKTFWICQRLFSIVTGPSMDYYTPLASREQSYKEFMQEWICDLFMHSIEDFGLKRPWYWDEFMDCLEHSHHSGHLGTWFYRWTLFWNPDAGVGRDEREWLNSKYPDWEEHWGPMWDQVIHNVNDGRPDLTLPTTLPWICNMCNLPVGCATSPKSAKYPVRPYKLVHNGQKYWFCSEPCRRIWWEDRNTMMHQQTIIDRLLGGAIQPADLTGAFDYMGVSSAEMGDDARGMSWAFDYAEEYAARQAAGS